MEGDFMTLIDSIPLFFAIEPVTIIALIGLALSAAGTAAGMAAQSKAKRAQDAARAAEMYRQSQHSKKAGAIVDQQIEKTTAPKGRAQIDEAARMRAADYNRITSQVQKPVRAVTNTVNTPFSTQTLTQNALAAQ